MGLMVGLMASVAHAAGVELAKDGKARQAIIISATADPVTQQAAKELAEYLSKISGASFDIQVGDGTTGIALGTAADFPSITLESPFDTNDIFQREDYLLRSHEKGLYVLAGTTRGVNNAVWDLLYRLGYRQFFPGANWEVIPSSPTLVIDVNARVHPHYLGRRIWYGFGNWRDCLEAKSRWDRRNRMADSLNVSMGHAWDAIYRAKKAEFDAHPEYLVSTRPVKFRVGHPGLRKLVVDYALEYFEKNPNAISVSMDPSDGGGWDDPEEEKLFKSVSDRVVTLANEVAEALSEKYPDKFVGMYAYHEHSPPPSIRVHPRVLVGVATGFIKGGYTVDQLMEGWAKQGATLGIREYYSVVVSHKERPGGIPASDLNRLVNNTRKFYRNGARLMTAESSDSWGGAGLSYYIASRLYWNVDEDVDALLDDFFVKAFGPAEKPMREFYKLLDRGNKPLFSTDLIGRMYRYLDEAHKLTDDPGIRGRLHDLTLYTRYVELLWNMQRSVSSEEATAPVLSFAYRIRHSHMVHSYALWRDTRGGGFAKPTGERIWSVPDGKNPWKSSEPFTEKDIATFIAEGIQNNEIADFTPVSYSDELVSAEPLKLDTSLPMGTHGYTRGKHVFLLWLDEPGTIPFEINAGQIAVHPTAQVTMNVYAEENPTDEPVAVVKAPMDRTFHSREMTSKYKGLHRIEMLDSGRGMMIRWPQGVRVSIPSSGQEQSLIRGRYHLYFYVPKGTRVVGGYSDGGAKVFDSKGREYYVLTTTPGYFSIPVPEGEDGKTWSLSGGGRKLLMTVPPYMARHPSELLLPREVVEADKPK